MQNAHQITITRGHMAAESIPRRNHFKVLRPMPTRWMDNDQYGHVNNVAYYSYFDSAVNGFLMDATASDTRTLGAIGIVAETSCKYFKEISFPDLLHIGLRLQKLGNSSVVYELAVFRGDDDEPSALGRFVHVYVDQKTRRPISIPTSIRNALQQLL
jgi:acyl-CoA thioester hydrolase